MRKMNIKSLVARVNEWLINFILCFNMYIDSRQMKKEQKKKDLAPIRFRPIAIAEINHRVHHCSYLCKFYFSYGKIEGYNAFSSLVSVYVKVSDFEEAYKDKCIYKYAEKSFKKI